jgi:hypothetical protein
MDSSELSEETDPASSTIDIVVIVGIEIGISHNDIFTSLNYLVAPIRDTWPRMVFLTLANRKTTFAQCSKEAWFLDAV